MFSSCRFIVSFLLLLIMEMEHLKLLDEWKDDKLFQGSCILLSVCSSCYNKIPNTGWLLNNHHFFSQFWGL